jgi:hypothetical protein
MQEAEIGRILFSGQPGQKAKPHFQNNQSIKGYKLLKL